MEIYPFGPTKHLWITLWLGRKSYNFPLRFGQEQEELTIVQGDPS